jgi:hypothetical protein
MNKTMVCRLGGFHTIMSFLGSIGSVMSGSGLEQVLEQCFGPNAVLHMLSGKAVSRSQRGHYLVEAALGIILVQRLTAASSEYKSLKGFNLTSDDISNIFSEHLTVMTDGLTDTFPSTSLLLLDKGLTLLKSELIQNS